MSSEPVPPVTLIRELDGLTGRTRRVGRSMATGVPLVGWGIAWLVGYPAVALLDGGARVAVLVVAMVIGLAASWAPGRAAVRTGRERALRRGWFVLLGSSPFLLATVGPLTVSEVALFLGALWGLGMALYATATADAPFVVVALVGVVSAGVAATQPWVPASLCYGIVSGLPLLALGLHRTVGPGRG